MSWDELARALNATPDDKGWLRVIRRFASEARHFVIQRVAIDGWQLVLIQTTIAREAQLGTFEAATRLVPYPLGALVFNEGFWVLRQALALDGLSSERFELVLRCLDMQARALVPALPQGAGRALYDHYTD